MSEQQAAVYARVSSEQQAEAKTIASQVAALQERVAADGFTLPAELQFIDEGYSGATLVRPALEQLRDLAAAGGVERLYVHSPDRLARKYAYQVLLLEELQLAGVEIVFLNRALGETPETTCCARSRGWSPSTSGPRFWSGADEANGMRRTTARSTCYLALPTATAISRRRRVAARRATRSC